MQSRVLRALELSPQLREGRPIDTGRNYGLLGDAFLERGDEERAIEIYELAG